jgi:hypothetical protein
MFNKKWHSVDYFDAIANRIFLGSMTYLTVVCIPIQ